MILVFPTLFHAKWSLITAVDDYDTIYILAPRSELIACWDLQSWSAAACDQPEQHQESKQLSARDYYVQGKLTIHAH